ncbi:MAG: Mpo1-like protein [Betaproteobacteria bacterium]
MKTLAQQMAVYNAYHQNDMNKATHFVGVPLIILGLLIPLSWPTLEIGGLSITAAMVFVGAVSIYYLVLDLRMGLLTAAAVLPLLWCAHLLAAQGAATGWIAFAIAFIGGWILQLIGHSIEGRRPALVDNFFQIFVAPVFLVAEALFAFGARAELKREVEALTVVKPATPSGHARAV